MTDGAFFRKTVYAVLVVLLIASSSFAGPIFVSGDTNIVDALLGITNGAPLDLGNQQFFTNILGSGTNVAILDTSVPFLEQSETVLNSFYSGLGGVSTTILSGTVAASDLVGVDLFLAPAPDDEFSPSEIAALSAFLAGSGTLFLSGENSSSEFTASNAAINAALSALGSSMTFVPDIFDPGFHQATILADPFTSGVTTFSYAAPSQVSGGTPIFLGTEERPFVAYEDVRQTPEPATLGLLGLALAVIGASGRRRYD